MDGREAMLVSGGGSAPYYMQNRGVFSGSQSTPQTGILQTPSGFRQSSSPNLSAQPNVGSTFAIEPKHVNFGHNIGVPAGASLSEPVKKKRGRPRKYAPDGQVSLGLSSLPAKPKPSRASDSQASKRGRGRPPGTGRKQQLANLGEWMNSSAGLAFAPHVVSIGVGEYTHGYMKTTAAWSLGFVMTMPLNENNVAFLGVDSLLCECIAEQSIMDIVAKMLSFSQQRPRAVCILSGSGTVSSVTLRQPASSVPTVTYEGHFEILCLSGSFLLDEDGGPRDRTGGVSASLSTPDGHVFGGGVAVLIASSPVQVVGCSFVCGGSKVRSKQVTSPESDKNSTPQPSNKSVTTIYAPASQHFSTPAMHAWPGSRTADLRNPHREIDLTRG